MRKDEYNSNLSAFSFNDAISCRDKCGLYFKQICCNNDSKVIITLIKFLTYSDIINLNLTCSVLNKKINEKIKKKYLRLGVISHSFRKVFWKANIKSEKKEEILRIETKDIEKNENLYEYFLKKSEDQKNNPPNKKIKTIYDEIGRDLNRTFHTEKFNSIDGQTQLGRLLGVIAYVRPEIGYCQGMNFVVASLLTILENEELAFWSFIVLLDDFELNSLYLKNMPDYSIRMYQLKYYIKLFFPEIFYHWKNHQINEIFISKWVLTIFSSYLPFETLAHVWDFFLIDGWKAIIKFSLIFILELKELILKKDLNSLSEYFRDNSRNLHQNVKWIISKYENFKVTNKDLNEMREQYFIELAKKKLEDLSSVWDNDQLDPLNLYKKETERLENIIKKEIALYQNLVMEIDKKYQISKKNYSQQYKICNSIKTKIEEYIDTHIAYESVFNILQTEQQNFNLMKKYSDRNSTSPSKKPPNDSLKKQTSSPLNNSFNKKSKITIEAEINLLEKKISFVKVQINHLNEKLNESYRIVDEKKYIMENLKKEKLKFKKGLEGYLKIYEIKENELLRNLADKLKLSEKFITNYQF